MQRAVREAALSDEAEHPTPPRSWHIGPASLRTPFVVLGTHEASLVEDPLPGAPLPGDPVRFEIGPYEVKTLRLRIAAPLAFADRSAPRP